MSEATTLEPYPLEPYKEEMINGLRVVLMAESASNHNTVVSNVHGMFHQFLKGKTCRAFVDGITVYLDENNRVVPDVFILCDRSKVQKNGIHGAPDLIVEVLSPGSQKRDRGDKKDLYEKFGVGEYWIIDPDKKNIEVYICQNNKLYLDDVYRLSSEDDPIEYQLKSHIHMNLFPDNQIDLQEIFEDVIDWR